MNILKLLNKISIVISYILTITSIITLIIGLTGFIETLETIPSSLAVKNGIGITFTFIYFIIGFINLIVFLIYIFTKHLLNERKIHNINKIKIMLLCLIINFIPLLICIVTFLKLLYKDI